MKTRITALLITCVMLIVSVQAAAAEGKISSVADPDRFTKSEAALSNNAHRYHMEEYGWSNDLMKTLSPARLNAFFL